MILVYYGRLLRKRMYIYNGVHGQEAFNELIIT